MWTDGKVIRDVSFVDTGETTTVFIPDDIGFDDAPGKMRFAFEETDKAMLADYEAIMIRCHLRKCLMQRLGRPTRRMKSGSPVSACLT